MGTKVCPNEILSTRAAPDYERSTNTADLQSGGAGLLGQCFPLAERNMRNTLGLTRERNEDNGTHTLSGAETKGSQTDVSTLHSETLGCISTEVLGILRFLRVFADALTMR